MINCKKEIRHVNITHNLFNVISPGTGIFFVVTRKVQNPVRRCIQDEVHVNIEQQLNEKS